MREELSDDQIREKLIEMRELEVRRSWADRMGLPAMMLAAASGSIITFELNEPIVIIPAFFSAMYAWGYCFSNEEKLNGQRFEILETLPKEFFWEFDNGSGRYPEAKALIDATSKRENPVWRLVENLGVKLGLIKADSEHTLREAALLQNILTHTPEPPL